MEIDHKIVIILSLFRWMSVIYCKDQNFGTQNFVIVEKILEFSSNLIHKIVAFL